MGIRSTHASWRASIDTLSTMGCGAIHRTLDTIGEIERARNEVNVLDLAQAGISSIVWATGFSRHFDWIESPSIAAGCDPCMFVESAPSPVCFSWASGGSTRVVRI